MKMIARISVEVDVENETEQTAHGKAVLELLKTCREFVEGTCVPYIEFELIDEFDNNIDKTYIN